MRGRASGQGQIVLDLTQDDSSPSQRSGAVGAQQDILDLTQESGADEAVPPSADTPASKRRRGPKEAAASTAAAAASQATAQGEQKTPKRKRQSKAAAGSAATAEATPQGKPKRGRKEKAPPKEKRQNSVGRTVPWSAKPSIKTQERIQRALPGSGHRLFLISRKTVAPVGSEGGPVEEFAVLGATGNVYTVTVGKHPSCTCPDAAKGNLCKHSLFVMLRVIRLAQNDPLVWQRALLKGEADEVLSGGRSLRSADGDVHASDAVRRAYSQATGDAAASSTAATPDSRRPVEGDCPVCFDDLRDSGGGSAAERTTLSCATCGNHLHTACFENWAKAKREQGLEVTCVYCRSKWPDEVAAGGDGRTLNLAQHSHAHHAGPQSLHQLYGARAVWIDHHARGGNARHAASLYSQLAGH